MSKRDRVSVREMAKEAGVGVDDAIIALWDAGYNEISLPTDVISGASLKSAYRALEIPTAMELRSSAYWMKRFNLGEEEFRRLLSDVGFNLAPMARRVPQGSARKLLQLARKRNAPPVEIVKAPVEQRKLEQSFVWRVVGHEKRLRFLTSKEVHAVHSALVHDFETKDDPIYPAGIKSLDLFESAVFRPQTSLGQTLKYPSVEMAGAALLHSLVHNHPFHNGNKRTALVALLVFLDKNNYLLTCEEDALFTLVLQVARHRLVESASNYLSDREVLAIAEWIHTNARTVIQGERAIPFHRLKRILSEYKCVFAGFGSSGCKVNIERLIPAKRNFIFTTPAKTLKTQIYYGGDGREVRKHTLNKVRSDLELDEAHGVDSSTFYDATPASASDFILAYRKTLDRLAVL